MWGRALYSLYHNSLSLNTGQVWVYCMFGQLGLTAVSDAGSLLFSSHAFPMVVTAPPSIFGSLRTTSYQPQEQDREQLGFLTVITAPPVSLPWLAPEPLLRGPSTLRFNFPSDLGLLRQGGNCTLEINLWPVANEFTFRRHQRTI